MILTMILIIFLGVLGGLIFQSALVTVVMVGLAVVGGLTFNTVKYTDQRRAISKPLGCTYLGHARDLYEVEFYSCGPNKEIIMASAGQQPKYKGE
jgi:hypothetical protein